MAFTFTGVSGNNTAAITQTGNYLSLSITSSITTSGANWSFVGTIGGTVQAGASTLDAVGRALINTTQSSVLTNARQIPSSWISSITSVAANATLVTVTGPRYFLADGTEDVFVGIAGDTMVVCQNERDLEAAATTDDNFWVDTSPSYAGITGARTDIPWGVGKPNLLRLGTNAQATRFFIAAGGAFCISDNTHVMWAQNGNTTVSTPAGATIQVVGTFIMGRHYTLPVGNGFSTALLYPGVALTSDTLATTHVANMNVGLESGAYAYFGGTVGGPSYGITTFQRSAATRLHFRKCNVWSVGNTVNTNTNPTIFCGAANAIVTCDELTLSGTHVLQREGSTMLIYSLRNAGGGFVHAVNGNAVTFNGYVNAGSQNGFDFGGYQSYATSAGGTNASIILSYNSTQGTNVYAGSADAAFSAGSQQNINIEFHRNLTLRATNPAGTTLTTPVAYLKDVTRTVTTTAANPRGAVSAAPDGTQATCGQTVTSRSGLTVLTDAQQVQFDRTYTAVSNTAAIDVLLGEIYTNDSTNPATTSRVGRPGYEGNSGLATNRMSRRGKDDTIASRANRDNYDIYWWDYNTLFGEAIDFSLNANSVQTQILLTDSNINQVLPATTAAYTTLETTAKIYDYAKYYKVASGVLNGRPLTQRLELGGIDGSTPGTALASGGGGYLCYQNGTALQFNPIFNSAFIRPGTATTPFQVDATAQGPINGSWNGTVYTYGDAVRPVSAATVQGALNFYAGTAFVTATSTFTGLNFGAIPVTLLAQARAAGNWATLSANQISLGTPGVAASWTSTYTPATTAGTGNLALSGLGALVPGGTVTASGIVTTATAAGTNTNVAAALQAALPTNSTVVAGTATGGVTGTIVYQAGSPNASGTTALVITINILSGAGATIGTGSFSQTGPNAGSWGYNSTADQNAIIAGIQSALRTALGNATLTITGAATIAYGVNNTYTINGNPLPLANMGLNNNLQIGSTGGSTGLINWARPINTQSVTATQAGSTLAITIPGVATTVTPIPAFTASGTTPPGTGFSNGFITSSGAFANGTTVYQTLTSATSITGLPTSNIVLTTGGAMLSGGAGSTYSITHVTNIGSTTLVLQNGTDTILSKNISSTDASRTLSVNSMLGYTGTLNINPGTFVYNVFLSDNNITGGLTINRTGSTGSVEVISSGNFGGTITAGTGVTVVSVSAIVIGGVPSTVTTAAQVRAIFMNATGTAYVTNLNPVITVGVGTVTIGITAVPATQYRVVVWIDNCYPVGGGATLSIDTANISLTATSIPNSIINFSSAITSSDIDIYSRSFVTYASASGLQTVTLNTPDANFIVNATIPGSSTLLYGQPTSGLWRQIVWRALAQSASSGGTSNIAFQNALSLGTLPSQFIQWNASGYTVQNGVSAASPTIQMTVQKGVSNNLTQILVNSFVDDTAGLKVLAFPLYQFATSTTDDGRVVTHQLNPAQAVSLSPADQNAVASYAVDGIVGTAAVPGPLSKVARGVENAQLLIPQTIAIP